MSKRRKRPAPIKVDPYVAYCKRDQDKRGRWYWQVGFFVGGKFQSARTLRATIDEIRHFMRELPVEIGVAWQPTEVETIEDLLAHWLRHTKCNRPIRKAFGEPGLSPNTIKQYQGGCNRLAKVAGGILIAQLTTRALGQIQNDLLKVYSSSSVRQSEKVLRYAWQWGLLEGHIESPMPRHKMIPAKSDAKLERVPSVADIEKILQWLIEQSPKRRNGTEYAQAYIEMLWATGARPRAIAELQWTDFDFARGFCKLGIKTRQRQFPLGGHFGDVAQAWKEHQEEKGHPVRTGSIWAPRSVKYVYVKVGVILGRACRALDIPHFSPKAFRQLAATTLLADRSVGRKEYEALMGHSFEIGMKIYSQTSTPGKVTAAKTLGRQRSDGVVSLEWHRAEASTKS